MYVYIQSERGEHSLWTVGFYDPKGKWIPESDHSSSEDAANRVAWLNGSYNINQVMGEALNSGKGVYKP